MNVNMNASVQAPVPMQGRPPPNSEQLATRMANAVGNGDVSIEQLQENLSERLQVDDTNSIVAEDGSVDVAALTEMLEINKPGGAGAPPQGPPPSGGPPRAGGGELTQQLTDILGEEVLEEVTAEDGSYNLEALTTALVEKLEAEDRSTTGSLLQLVA